MNISFPGLDKSTLPFSYDSLLHLLDNVIKSGKAALEMRAEVDITTKSSPEDLVTCADKKLSDILMAVLSEEFPNDHIMSEEHPWEEMGAQDRRWFIDPIDGTKYYVNETGQWSVMMGLVSGNDPIFGIFYLPAKNLLYFGGPSCGSWCWEVGGPATKLSVAPVTSVTSVTALLSKNDVAKNLWCKEVSGINVVTASSIGVDVHEVLQGQADVFVHIRPTLKVWDTAAPSAVALGAGLEIGTENAYGFTYPIEDPAHNYNVVIGRKGTVSWWQKGFMTCAPVSTPVPPMVAVVS